MTEQLTGMIGRNLRTIQSQVGNDEMQTVALVGTAKNVGLAVLPTLVITSPSVQQNLEAEFARIAPSVRAYIRLLKDPTNTDKATTTKNLVALLKSTTLSASAEAIAMIPMHDIEWDNPRRRSKLKIEVDYAARWSPKPPVMDVRYNFLTTEWSKNFAVMLSQLGDAFEAADGPTRIALVQTHFEALSAFAQTMEDTRQWYYRAYPDPTEEMLDRYVRYAGPSDEQLADILAVIHGWAPGIQEAIRAIPSSISKAYACIEGADPEHTKTVRLQIAMLLQHAGLMVPAHVSAGARDHAERWLDEQWIKPDPTLLKTADYTIVLDKQRGPLGAAIAEWENNKDNAGKKLPINSIVEALTPEQRAESQWDRKTVIWQFVGKEQLTEGAYHPPVVSSGWLVYRTQTTVYNRTARQIAEYVLAELFRQYNDPALVKYRELRMKRIQDDVPKSTSVFDQLNKEELQWKSAYECMEFYSKLSLATNPNSLVTSPLAGGPSTMAAVASKLLGPDGLPLPGAVLAMSEAMDNGRTTSALIAAINNHWASAMFFEYLPVYKPFMDRKLTITIPTIGPYATPPLYYSELIKKELELMASMEAIKQLLDGVLGPMPIAQRVTWAANTGRWRALGHLTYRRIFYAIGDPKTNVVDLNPFFDNGGVVFESLDPAVKGSIMREASHACVMYTPQMNIPMIRPVGVTSQTTIWPDLYTTDTPSTAGRQIQIPMWELFPFLPDSKFERLFQSLIELVKLAPNGYGMDPYLLPEEFAALGWCFAIDAQAVQTPKLEDISCVQCMTIKEPIDLLVGQPLIPKDLLGELSYKPFDAQIEQTVPWNIL